MLIKVKGRTRRKQSRYLCAVAPSKNQTTIALMGSSLALLLVLQIFWLYNSYEKSFFDFRKDVDGMFRNTVLALRDSMILQHLEALPPDSTDRSNSTFVFSQKMDSTIVNGKAQIRLSRNASSKHLSMFIASTTGRDSLKAMLKPIVGRIRDRKITHGNFVIRIGGDSLNADSISQHFSKALLASGRNLSFTIRKAQSLEGADFPLPQEFKSHFPTRIREGAVPANPTTFSDTLKTDWVHVDPLNQYAAEVSGMRLVILKDISPQILFSVFLTALTTVAFFAMYRNIKSQQRLMEIKNDFISNVTHELKTPVATVSVALEALRNFKGLENPQRTEEYLDIAQSELNRLTILTDKILKTATFESKGVHFEAEPVDLLKTLDQVLLSMKLVFEKQKAKVSFEKMGDSFVIHGGSVHLTNVIYNLLDNALKYSEGEPAISISLNANDHNVTLRVADKGIGIPKEYTKKIFEKFFRVPAGDLHNVKGYGLGLSYVESVIKSHKGNIEVQSEKGKGSVFTISLPKLVTTS
jgi:two-component system, OmpR family, phosphate regulon sensor histidine kinase PhoR